MSLQPEDCFAGHFWKRPNSTPLVKCIRTSESRFVTDVERMQEMREVEEL